jgi:hypothetical protein
MSRFAVAVALTLTDRRTKASSPLIRYHSHWSDHLMNCCPGV